MRGMRMHQHCCMDADYCSRTIVTNFSRCFKSGRGRFFQLSAAFCLEIRSYFALADESRVPSYCCSAVLRSLIAKPPPFLGVSSLNLAALTERPFFLRRSFASWVRRAVAHGPKPTSLRAPAHATKSLAQKSEDWFEVIQRLRAASRGVPRCASGMAVRCAMARVRRACTASK